jgi:hypothetical protein
MPPLPPVDKFIPCAEAISSLKKGELRCIWYLPDKDRRCLVEITENDREVALQQIGSVLKSCQATGTLAIQDLADVVEHLCCGRWHRNKAWGSGLSQELARRWQDEMYALLAQLARSTPPRVKQEHVGVNIRSIPLAPPRIPTTSCNTPVSTPVAFAKHQVFKGDTLLSGLLSDIDLRACKQGSIYFYTHADDAFRGMIKIGYTSRSVASRLLDWAECGHGDPVLLDSWYARHPNRVELLIHFELEQSWHALRWCKVHQQSHIEWFKVDCTRARTIAQRWCEWMERANPYDRRGRLTSSWVGHITFLVENGCLITAEAMAQIQRIEEGSAEVLEFVDDEVLRRSNRKNVKEENV